VTPPEVVCGIQSREKKEDENHRLRSHQKMNHGGNHGEREQQPEFLVCFWHTVVIGKPGRQLEWALQGLAGPGMGLVVNLEHVLDGELGVALSRGEAFVAKHLLNSAQVGAFFEHVSSERMP
jgi:hypothetical protein